MKKIMKQLTTMLKILAICLVFFYSCKKDALQQEPKQESKSVSAVPNVTTIPLASYTLDDLEQVAQDLEKQGYSVSNIMKDIKENNPSEPNTFISAFIIKSQKIVVQLPNPANPSTKINVSAILLYPHLHNRLRKTRLIVAAPGTYVKDRYAPSNLFGNLWTLSAADLINGVAIAPYLLNAGLHPMLIIDYPGFGSSRGQIQHPYLDQKVIAETSVSLIRAAQKTLANDRLKLKDEQLIITGYSQGAFAATSIARAIETNPLNKDLQIKLTYVAGIPANLTKVLDYSIARDHADIPYFFPYGLWGYKKVRYPNIPTEKIIKEPYHSISISDFTGLGAKDYPKKLSEIYSKDFLTSYKTNNTYAEVRRALDENNIQPWINKTPFFIGHGTADTTVDFKQSQDFAKEMNAAGGNIKFIPYQGLNHYTGAVAYFAAFYLQLANTK